MAYTRKSFSGSAIKTTLTAAISSTATSIAVAATTNFPNTTTGPFVVTIDRGNGTLEEKVLIAAYTSTLLTVATNGRGFDGTTAQSHSLGAPLVHTIDATSISHHDAFVAYCGTVTPHASAVGDTATDGATGKPADANHRHARESFATGASTTSKPGDTKADGTSTSPARADHKHGREGMQFPVGGICTWASTTLPPSTTGTFLFLHGQTVTGGAATYPTLAARYASWVVTGNLVLPDTRTKFVIGAGTKTAGTTGGHSSVTLTSGMLPKTSVSITDPTHTHTPTVAAHKHASASGYDFIYGSTGSSTVFTNSGSNVDHSPDWNLGAETATATTTVSVTIGSSSTGVSASFGETTPTAVTTTPPYIAFNKIVRAA